MEHFGSFIAAAWVPYTIGFVMLGVWWRWWLLLPVSTVVVIFVLAFAGAGDGPGATLGAVLVYFFSLGAGCGFVASTAVMICRSNGWRLLTPTFFLPMTFVLGFGSHMAFYWSHEVAHDARNAPPSEACLRTVFAARIADGDLVLPINPALSFIEKDNARLYGLGHNPDVSDLCSSMTTKRVELRYLLLQFKDLWNNTTTEAKIAFCARNHPEYPWADKVCNPIPVTTTTFEWPDSVSIALSEHKQTSVTNDDDRMLKCPMSITTDGVKIFRCENELLLQRADGYVAQCRSDRAPQTKSYLFCQASEKLSEELTMSYEFITTETRFSMATPGISAAARGYFESLTK